MQADPSVKFAVLVTGDHSTPVMFGDHSHEPVPLAVADVADVAAALGTQWLQVAWRGPLRPLTQHDVVPEVELQEQAARQKEARRQALARNADSVRCSDGADSAWLAQRNDGATGVRRGREMATGGGLCRFDEVTAARGCLGRFPSSELMPLIQSILEVSADAERSGGVV
jgi:hypothetical protein